MQDFFFFLHKTSYLDLMWAGQPGLDMWPGGQHSHFVANIANCFIAIFYTLCRLCSACSCKYVSLQ